MKSKLLGLSLVTLVAVVWALPGTTTAQLPPIPGPCQVSMDQIRCELNTQALYNRCLVDNQGDLLMERICWIDFLEGMQLCDQIPMTCQPGVRPPTVCGGDPDCDTSLQ